MYTLPQSENRETFTVVFATIQLSLNLLCDIIYDATMRSASNIWGI